MRRITTTFAILLFISLSQFSLAQEKQNDATWEETIDFLQKNVAVFLTKEEIVVNGGKNRYYVNTEEIKFENGFMKVFKHMYAKNAFDLHPHASVDLSKLNNVEFKVINDANVLILNFEPNSVLSSVLEVPNETKRTSVFHFSNCIIRGDVCVEYAWFKNDEIIVRLEKAFKHLAYLANEERKKSKF